MNSKHYFRLPVFEKNWAMVVSTSRGQSNSNFQVSTLNSNLLLVLGENSGVDKRRIVELEDEAAFGADHATCTKVKSGMVTPKARLSIELRGCRPCSTVEKTLLRDYGRMLQCLS